MEEISVFFAVDAEQYLISGFPSEAIELCRRGLEVYPEYSAAYTVLARAYKALGDDAQAQAVLESASEKFTDKRLFEPAKRNLDFVPTFLQKQDQPPVADLPEELDTATDAQSVELDAANKIDEIVIDIEGYEPDGMIAQPDEMIAQPDEMIAQPDIDLQDVLAGEGAVDESSAEAEVEISANFSKTNESEEESLMLAEMALTARAEPEALAYIDDALGFEPAAETNSDIEDTNEIDGNPTEPVEDAVEIWTEAEVDDVSATEETETIDYDTEIVDNGSGSGTDADSGESVFENSIEEETFAIESVDDESDEVLESLAEESTTEGTTTGGNFILRAVNLSAGEEDDSRELRAWNLSLIPGLDFSPLKSGVRRSERKPIGQEIDFPGFELDNDEIDSANGALFGTDVPRESETSEGGFNLSELAAQLESVSLPKPRAAVAELNDEAHVSGFASETMAFIYEQQGAWEAALDSYRKLLLAKPERADFYIERIEKIEGNL